LFLNSLRTYVAFILILKAQLDRITLVEIFNIEPYGILNNHSVFKC